MDALVVTTCSNRKRLKPSERLKARNLDAGSLKSVTREWSKRIRSANECVLARDQYCGRGFREAEKAAMALNQSPWVISAGLGVISPEDRIPAYDLTLTTSSADCIFKRISEPATPTDWWESVAQQNKTEHPLSQLVHTHPKSLVLIAASGPYTNLVSNDLMNLSKKERSRVRIFGPQNTSKLPDDIAAIVMPYDARFDGPKSPNPGTRTDFPQRTLRHFVEVIRPQARTNASVQRHAELVHQCLTSWPVTPKVERTPKTDDEIIDLVPRLWETAQGSSTKMLRVLRDQELVACEQGRFASLFKVAKERYSL